MNVASWLKSATPSVSRLDAELILAHTLDVDRSFLHAHPEQILSSTQLAQSLQLLNQRRQKVPIAYILGEKAFYGRNFRVSPNVLIPRPSTESLISATLPYLNPTTSVLEIGTGSGCISITLALEQPDLRIFATDLSPNALKIAQDNACRYGVSDRITFLESDLFAKIEESYDLILANLPYVDSRWSWNSPELQFEPRIALYASDSGLATIKRFIAQSPLFLKSKGHIILESDPCQQSDIIQYAQKFKFEVVQNLDFVLVLQLGV